MVSQKSWIWPLVSLVYVLNKNDDKKEFQPFKTRNRHLYTTTAQPIPYSILGPSYRIPVRRLHYRPRLSKM